MAQFKAIIFPKKMDPKFLAILKIKLMENHPQKETTSKQARSNPVAMAAACLVISSESRNE
jgi:hypothetical protein